jgi:hypothetical protein
LNFEGVALDGSDEGCSSLQGLSMHISLTGGVIGRNANVQVLLRNLQL